MILMILMIMMMIRIIRIALFGKGRDAESTQMC